MLFLDKNQMFFEINIMQYFSKYVDQLFIGIGDL